MLLLSSVYIYIGETLCYVIKYFTTFFASKYFSYFPPLKSRCVLWSEKIR